MKVLFVCKHNSCRSILAEAIAKRFLPPRFEVVSGGSDPTGDLHPFVQQYLNDMGLDAKDFRSKSWEEFVHFHPDIVISVCDIQHGEQGPNWLADGVRVYWGLNNPLDFADDEAQFEEQCHLASVTLKKRIDILATCYFENMTHQEVHAELESIGAMG